MPRAEEPQPLDATKATPKNLGPPNFSGAQNSPGLAPTLTPYAKVTPGVLPTRLKALDQLSPPG
jgi:hypothetical protein